MTKAALTNSATKKANKRWMKNMFGPPSASYVRVLRLIGEAREKVYGVDPALGHP